MDALKFTECMQVIVKGKEHWGIPEHYCCVRGPCRSHQCWWPQTRSRYWNDRTSPSWSAQRPASPFWLSYERPQTLRGGQEQIHEIITALERCCIPLIYSRPLPLFCHLTVTGLLELVSHTLELLHGLHVGCADPLQDTLLLVQTLLQCVCLCLDLFFWQCIL